MSLPPTVPAPVSLEMMEGLEKVIGAADRLDLTRAELFQFQALRLQMLQATYQHRRDPKWNALDHKARILGWLRP